MERKSPERIGYERVAVSHELAILIGYAQMIEVLSGHPTFLRHFGGPFPFVLCCSLVMLLFLLPVPSMVRGRRWAMVCSWSLAFVCLTDGFLFLLTPSSGWLSSLGLVAAGLFLLDRLFRYADIKGSLHEPMSGHSSVS